MRSRPWVSDRVNMCQPRAPFIRFAGAPADRSSSVGWPGEWVGKHKPQGTCVNRSEDLEHFACWHRLDILPGSRTHARTERAEDFPTDGAALALNPWRTDSVSRGLSISLFTLEIISLAISIRLFFFINRPFFEP